MHNKFEPIPVKLRDLIMFLEDEFADPEIRWIQLKAFLAKQEAAQSAEPTCSICGETEAGHSKRNHAFSAMPAAKTAS